MRKLRLLSAVPLVTAVLVVGGASGASAAPAAQSSCVAKAATNPELGPPGRAGIPGPVVGFLARLPHQSCPFSS